MLPINKIYIDSRYMSGDSASGSSFYIDLPINMLMPDNTGFYIDDVAIPVSLYTIEEGRNNELYVGVNGVLHAFTIASGNYSLVSPNEGIVATMNLIHSGYFSAAPNVAQNTIGIAGMTTAVSEILTDSQLRALNINADKTINNVLRNFTPSTHNNTNP